MQSVMFLDCHIQAIWEFSSNLNSLRSCFNDTSSQVTNVIVFYFCIYLDTTICFLFLHGIKLHPTRTQFLEVEGVSLGDPTQNNKISNNLSISFIFIIP